MKKNTKLLLIVLILLMILSVAALAACKDDLPDGKIKITVNVNISGAENAEFTVDANAEFYSLLTSYVPQETNGLTFAGWYDSDGKAVTAATRWESSGTVTAYWSTSYAVEYYLESADGFALSSAHSDAKTGVVGSTVTAEQIAIAGYVYDASNSQNVSTATLAADTVLKMYYKRATFTVSFDKNNADATGAMGAQTVYYGESAAINDCAFLSSYEFGGWNTQADGLGDGYANGAQITLTENNITLYAQWKISYTEELWAEKFDGTNYVYVKLKTSTLNGFLNNSVSVQVGLSDEDYETLGHNHYSLDYSHPDAVAGTNALQNGDVLKAYYSIDRYNVTYVGEGIVDTVRYGDKYTVRTPVNSESQTIIVTYSSSQTGNGAEYPFGAQITLSDNLYLYPITADVFTDSGDSGDKVQIRANVSGVGAAKLIKKDGSVHEGFIEVAQDVITFTVTVRQNDQDEGTTVHGKLNADGTFVYRNEDEAGTYLYLDPLFPDSVYVYPMLALDGYGTGVLAQPAADGSSRTENYFVTYEKTEEGDYYISYYLPANPSNVLNDLIQIVRAPIEGSEEIGEDVVGYFMFFGTEYGSYTLVYNGSVNSDCGLFLDGYGAAYYVVNGVEREGVYRASANYDEDEGYYEYEYLPLDTAQDSFVFILLAERNPNTGEKVLLFVQKHNEVGVYTAAADVNYPELYLDGYGGAMYSSSENDSGLLGTYEVEQKDDGYEVFITFVGDNAGTLRVSLDQQNNTFTALDNSFRVSADGVLSEYFGTSSVIVVPSEVDGITVTKIADEVFNGKNIVSVTIPDTVTEIGAYAFRNDHVLRTVYVGAATPPVLGETVFNWLRSDFLIIVPDGSEDAYRAADGWSDYAKYITSNLEINTKPEFEVDENGVLISYNPAEQVADVTIPEQVNGVTVTAIADNVFSYREYIQSVNLNKVTAIGDHAFDSCINLKTVTFNPNTVSIGKYAFFYCLALSEADLGNVQTIDEYAFFRCYNLAKVNLGSRIARIGQFAFSYCAVKENDVGDLIYNGNIDFTVTATAAPEMSNYVFLQSPARVYVDSYEIGVSFARTPSWKMYAGTLNVKSDKSQVFYSLSNMGMPLVLGDNALLQDSRPGLYKWKGNKLTVAWFDRDDYTSQLTVLEQQGTLDEQTGIIRYGFTLSDSSTPLVLIAYGSTADYTSGSETLRLTFGTGEAVFNGSDVTVEVVNYRMRFTHDGYVYSLTLTDDGSFSYTRTKVTTTKTYTAGDGSQITVTFGSSVKAIGTLKDVGGNERTTEAGWYASLNDDGTYYWTIQYANCPTYLITVELDDEDNTFTYSAQVYYTQTVYRSNSNRVQVRSYYDGTIEMQFVFNTANGELQSSFVKAQAVQGSDNIYVVTIAIPVDVFDDEGNKTGEVPSEFDGTYNVTLNSSDSSFVMTKVS